MMRRGFGRAGVCGGFVATGLAAVIAPVMLEPLCNLPRACRGDE